MAYIYGAVLLLVASAAAIPVRYDQRQDGDWNVDAKLQNFFVVLAPSATSPANGVSPSINLLEFASKAVPLRLPIRPGSGLQAAAAAIAAATGVASAPPSNNDPAQERRVSPIVEAAPAARAALGYFAASNAAADAVPMLVAVPVPEVAPLPGAVYIPAPAVPVQAALTLNHIQPQGEPNALLPMLTVIKPESNNKLAVESVPAEALSATLQQQPAEKLPSQAITPETPALPAKVLAQENPLQAAPSPAAPGPQEPPRFVLENSALRLVGTGVEDCGPSRARNANGVCEEARSTKRKRVVNT